MNVCTVLNHPQCGILAFAAAWAAFALAKAVIRFMFPLVARLATGGA